MDLDYVFEHGYGVYQSVEMKQCRYQEDFEEVPILLAASASEVGLPGKIIIVLV